MCLEIYKHPLLINVYPTAATCVPWYVCGNHVAGSVVNAVGIRLTGLQAVGNSSSLPPISSRWGCAVITVAGTTVSGCFVWVLGICTQAVRLVWQTLYPLSHLPCPVLHYFKPQT